MFSAIFLLLLLETSFLCLVITKNVLPHKSILLIREPYYNNFVKHLMIYKTSSWRTFWVRGAIEPFADYVYMTFHFIVIMAEIYLCPSKEPCYTNFTADKFKNKTTPETTSMFMTGEMKDLVFSSYIAYLQIKHCK